MGATHRRHNKFVTIDGAILITGSFNWTRQAVLSNQENLVILQSAQAVGGWVGWGGGQTGVVPTPPVCQAGVPLQPRSLAPWLTRLLRPALPQVGAFKGKFEQLWQKYARNG